MKNNKSWKSFAAGMIVMAILVALCAPALAAGSLTNLQDVLVGGIRIVIDGQELHPTDANGKPVDAMIYNGTTYLPVRAVANALNKAVSWDGPTYTVYLGDMDGQLEYPTVMLKDMTSIAEKPNQTDALTDNYGNRYASAIDNRGRENGRAELPYEYLLNMKYSRFKGTLYVPKGVTSNNSCFLTVKADGRILYTSPEMNKASSPIAVDVNVAGYNDVVIEWSMISNYYSSNKSFTCCLADAGFYQ